MLRAFLALGFVSGSVLADPGHGAPEIHWHAGDLVLVALWVGAVAALVYVLKRKQKQ